MDRIELLLLESCLHGLRERPEIAIKENAAEVIILWGEFKPLAAIFSQESTHMRGGHEIKLRSHQVNIIANELLKFCLKFAHEHSP